MGLHLTYSKKTRLKKSQSYSVQSHIQKWLFYDSFLQKYIYFPWLHLTSQTFAERRNRKKDSEDDTISL